MMDDFVDVLEKKCKKYDPSDPKNAQTALSVQFVLSLALGASAFIAFCVSTTLRQNGKASN